MQRIQLFITGYIMMALQWLNTKLGFINNLFQKFDVNNPDHWETLTGTMMNIIGIISFAVGLFFTIRKAVKSRRKK